MKRPFLLKKRGNVYYYRLAEEPTFHSTGKKSRATAEAWILGKIQTPEAAPAADRRLLDYAAPYFGWDSCPHARRLRDEGKSLTARHVHIQRLRLEKHVLSDPIAAMSLGDIRRADLLDFRSRVRAATTPSTTNKVMGVLKVILREAFYREDIESDPTAGIGQIRYQERQRDTFRAEELHALFPASGVGPWSSLLDYTCFFLTAMTGMRRGEVLALRWCDVDFDAAIVHVRRALKGVREFGPPKWGKERSFPMALPLMERLRWWSTVTEQSAEEDLVFCYPDGTPLGGTWWRQRFQRAIEAAAIEPGARQLTPHCLRHSVATHLRASGVDPAKIRAMLGWSDEATQETYTHWEPRHLQDVADAAAELLS
jgi:integrase